jgi:ubiquitin-like protein ATG12
MEDPRPDKVIVNLRPVASAPILQKSRIKLDSSDSVSRLIAYISKQIKAKSPIFVYINSSFCPAPEALIGDLYQCFRVGEELAVNYAVTEAWG